jgi:hypothetical protein
MDEAAEHIATPDLSRVDPRCTLLPRLGNGQREAAVRSLLVVVADVAARQPQQMAPPEHQRPVQTLRAHGLDPPLSMGIRLRRPNRRPEDALPSPNRRCRPARDAFGQLAVSGQPTPNAGRTIAGGDDRALQAQQRVGWQPSRFLADRAEAERAFALAERLRSVNAAAAELGTTWKSLRKAFARHGRGMPARNLEAVRQRVVVAASRRGRQPPRRPARRAPAGPDVHRR